MISAKVTANTINMRRSPPGSCWGFLYSAKFKFRSTGENLPAQSPGICSLISRSPVARDQIPARAKGWQRSSRAGGQRASAKHAVALDRFHRILRAGGNETAGMRQHGRDDSLVAPQHELHRLLHFCSPIRARCAASRKARVTSLTSSAKGNVANALARIKHDVDRTVAGLGREPYRVAHPPLDAVALDRSSQHLAHGETYTWRVGRSHRFRAAAAPQKEHGHVSRKLPAAALVHPLKIRVLQQTPRFWKLAAGGGGHIKRSALTRRVSVLAAAESCDDSRLLRWKGRDNADFGSSGLIAEARADRDALAPLGPTARQHRPAALGLHARTKSVRLRAVTTVGLECALGHSKTALLTS